ncbi:MAG: YihY/virulence factor BrkB family protein [Luteolibacter sp.]
MSLHFPKLLNFIWRVVRNFFFQNNGMLLTAAVAYHLLISIIPLCAVLVVIFSHFIDQDQLLKSIATEVSFIAPGFTPTLMDVLRAFLRTREFVGWVGVGILLFSSSVAFRVFENAFAIIFHRPVPGVKRKFWISALLPYIFIFIVGIGLVFVTTVTAVLDAQNSHRFVLFGFDLANRRTLGLLIYLTSWLSLVLLFALLYKFMPIAKIPVRHALYGGLTATILWEAIRHLLVTYFTKISSVNVVYGSMATIVIVLITFEMVSLIVLLGAQVIAELQACSQAGLRWHENPEEKLLTDQTDLTP